jgi:hypothetical protein
MIWGCYKRLKQRMERTKIDMCNPDDVEYWTNELGVSKERLQRAIDEAGNSELAVRRHIG